MNNPSTPSSIRTNLLSVMDMVREEPEHLFDLEAFESEASCGTLHCTLGLIAISGKWPEITLISNVSLNYGVVIVDGSAPQDSRFYVELDGLFGHGAYDALFGRRGDSFTDPLEINKADAEGRNVSDKELAITRLEWQLKNYPA